MINFYEFEQILQENKTLDKIKVGLKRTGEKIDKLLGDNPHQRQADNRKNNKDKAQFDKMLGDLTKESAEEGEYYAEYDKDYGKWCVFHTHKHQKGKVTKHRGCFSNKEQAEKHAKKLNNPDMKS
jgi:hypothetical protein